MDKWIDLFESLDGAALFMLGLYAGLLVIGVMMIIFPGMDKRMTKSMDEIQAEITQWIEYNFGNQVSEIRTYGGFCEEVGEVMRAVTKRSQGIRGTRQEWTAELKKELGDVLIKLFDIAEVEGWSLQEVLEERWAEIQQRDWQRYPQTGRPPQ